MSGSGMIAFIDPGHGGHKPGAVTDDPWPIREADVCWSVAAQVVTALRAGGHSARMTRKQGERVKTRERALGINMAVEAAPNIAPLLVSIHCNSSTNPAAHGIEILHYGSDAGVAFAEHLLEFVIQGARDAAQAMGQSIKSRGLVERPDLNILRLTRPPAVLVEMPFISNPREARLLVDADFQSAVARAIAGGVTSFAGRGES